MENKLNSGCRTLVVIPCLNEVRHLENVVTTLVNGKVPSMAMVIVDGGSTDGSVALAHDLAARFSSVSMLANPKRIQSAGVNLAVQTFGKHAEFLIRIDAHADYPKDYCHVLIEEAERTHASSVVVGMKTAGDQWFQRAVARAQNSLLGNGGSGHRVISKNGRWTEHGHHALMRIDAFLRVGGYDESFSHNEDVELDTRLRQNGYKIWLTGRTSITYYPRSSPASLFRQSVNLGAGRARTMFKHRKTAKLRHFAVAMVLPVGLLACASPMAWLAVVPLATWVALCLGYGLFLGLKERSSSGIAAGPAAMIMHAGWSVGFWRSVMWKLRDTLIARSDMSRKLW
jgi:succinoglycan biosynthesis protein ExoA